LYTIGVCNHNHRANFLFFWGQIEMILGANQFGFPAVGKFLAGNLKLGSINQKFIQIKSSYNACYAAVGGGLVGWLG